MTNDSIKVIPADTLWDLLKTDFFRQRIAMLIGKKDIFLLRAFIDGYLFFGNRLPKHPMDETFPRFHDWVANELGYFESTSGWANMITDECGGDPEKAVDLFIELFDRFRLEMDSE